MAHHHLDDVILLLVLAVAAVAVFGRLRLPPILGYLFVGAIAGPHALALIDTGETTRLLGEIGVAFLLFTIGLEFSLARFRAMRDTLIRLGGTQVAIGTLSGAIIARALGMDWPAAIVVGGALSLSSTAIVVKQLSDRLELHARHGQLALGILLFQDLAAVPFLVMIPLLAPGGAGPALGPLLVALAKAVFAVAAMLGAGRWLLRPLFHEVSAARYPELFTLAALAVSLAAAWLTGKMGLSLALGAFLAGLMLGETEYRHQIESDIRPFRDVLLGLFFVTVGMQLDARAMAPFWPWILLLVSGVVAGKGAVIALLTRVAGYGPRISVRTGTVLGQGGEFGIALVTLAAATGLLLPVHTQIIISVIIVTMAIAPLLIAVNHALAERLVAPYAAGEAPEAPGSLAELSAGLSGHVVLCGYGRTGALIGRILSAEGIPWAAIDSDPQCVRDAWERGDNVLFGNARHREVLLGAGLARAGVLVVTFEDLDAATAVVRTARRARPDLPVLVRARESQGLERLMEAGATEGVPEAFETALMLALQLLLFMQVPAQAARRRIQAVQRQQYPLLGAFFQTLEGATGGTDAGDGHLHSMVIPAGADAVGKRIEDLDLEAHGVVPVTLRRAGGRSLRPDPDVQIQPGDVLILHGRAEALAAAQRRLLTGSADAAPRPR